MPPGNADPLASLRDGEPGPLYWIFGKERFLVDRAVAILRERVLDPRTRDFNYDLLYAKAATPSRIVAAARTLPMMARRRLVLVRDADGLDAAALDELSSYVSDPVPEACLVFVAEKADQRMKFFTQFKKRGVLLKLDPLGERQLGPFVRSEAAARGLRFDAGAAELCADEVGGDLGQLVDAVERLALFVGERKTISNEDVEAVVATTRQRSVFELCDALGMGDTARALLALGSLFAAREPALRILAMVARLVRQMMVARELLDGRASRADIAQALGLPPFVAEKIEAQARRFDAVSLRTMHRAVFQTDRTLKSGKLDDERVMERLILELMRARPAPRAAAADGARR